jgi:RHS repeat-associated protein
MSRAARHLRAVVASVLAGTAALAVMAASGSASPDARHAAPPGPPPAPGPTAQQRGIPPQDAASVAERQRSERAYQGQSRAQAVQLMHQKFSRQLGALDAQPGRWLDPSDFMHFYSDRVALIDPPGPQGPELLQSMFPLRAETSNGKTDPLNLDLTGQGTDYVPENPIAAVTLPGNAGSEIRLQDARVGIRLQSAGADQAQASDLDGNKLFYPDAAPDTDLLLAPTAQGLELSAQIRSVDAPERFSFHVDLPANGALREGDTGLEVIQADKRTALIGTPTATDAQGTPVDTKLELTGPDSFDLVVSHQQVDRAYPILVDPPIDEVFADAQSVPPGWSVGGAQNPPNSANFADGISGGPSLWAQAGEAYGNGTWKEWVYTVPGSTTFISTALLDVGYINDEQTFSEPHGFVGLWSSFLGHWISQNNNQPDFFYFDWGPGQDYDLWYDGGGAANHTNAVILGMQNLAGGTVIPQAGRQLYLDAADVALDDPEPPSLSVSPPSGWIHDALSFGASDPGLGLADVVAYDAKTNDVLSVWDPNCYGTAGSRCPPSASTSLQNLPEGHRTVVVKAEDPTAKVTSSQQLDVKVDRSSPTIDLSGTLPDSAASGDLSDGTYGLDIIAHDGSSDDPTDERSGVREVKLLLDGAPITGQDFVADCTDPKGSCEQSHHYDLNTATLTNPDPTHQYDLQVQATDQAGNPATTRDIKFTVHQLPGVITSPRTGDTTARRFTITSERHDAAYSAVTYQYSTDGGTTYQTIPLSTLQYADGASAGTSPSAYPLALDSGTGQAPKVTWDVASTPGIADGAQFKIRAKFSTPPPDQVLKNDGPSLYWRLGESSGTTAADSSTGNHPGTYGGSPQMHQPGALPAAFDDGAVTLNGSQGLISNYNPFSNGTARTYEIWAKRDTNTTNDVIFGSSQNGMLLYGVPGDNNLWFRTSAAGPYIAWGNALPTGSWTHLALVVDEANDKVTLYKNGVSLGTQAYTGQYSATPGNLWIGGWVASASDDFNGSFDEAAVYEKGLSAAQIKRHYDGYSGDFSPGVTAYLDRNKTSVKHASAAVGPGILDLLTGNYAISADDVSIKGFASDLTFSRTFNSRSATGGSPYSPLGPGWIPSVPVDAAGSDYTKLSEVGPAGSEDSIIQITQSEGNKINFTKVNGAYQAEPLYNGLTLTSSGSGTGKQYTVTDLAGTVVSFIKPQGATDLTAGDYLPVKVEQAGDSARQNTTHLVYETINATDDPNPPRVTRVSYAVAPAASGVNCLDSSGNPLFVAGGGAVPAGCRVLRFVYTFHSAPPPAPGSFGDYPTRLHSVIFYGPGSTTSNGVTVAQYSYDSNGRLHAEWDPRISQSTSCGVPTNPVTCSDLKTTYAYDSATGLITTLTPPGQNAWSFTYTSTASDPPPSQTSPPSRLATASRTDPDGTTATQSVVYDVPLAGGNGAPNMTPSAVAQWGQADLPTDATAIFPAGTASPDYQKAAITYMNRNGDPVNTALAGNITTTEYESHRRVVRTLSAQNRAVALASSNPVQTAKLLDTQNTYGANGLELQQTLGPQHYVQVTQGAQPVLARQHVVTQYDQNRPSGQDYHLPTTVTETAQLTSNGSDVDARVAKTDYDWLLRQPSVQTVDPGGLNLKTTTRYDDAAGLPIETRLPGAPDAGDPTHAGTDPHSTETTYYTADGSSPNSGCRNQPAWANLPCVVYPATQPTPGVPDPVYQYDDYGNTTAEIDLQGANWADTRTTTTTYDVAERATKVHTAGSVGTAVPDITTTYDSGTGQVQSTYDGTRSIDRHYDALGRLTAYTDADGYTSSFAYDAQDRLSAWNDGIRAWQSFAYDDAGRISAMLDSLTGFYYSAYNADGALTAESMPNGMLLQNLYDETGTPSARGYTLGANSIMGFTQWRSVHGQVTRDDTTTNGSPTETDLESYDAAGRLTQSRDSTPSGGCVEQNYTYDQDTNRTAQQSLPATAPGVQCDPNPSSTAGSTITHTYDSADRLLKSGAGSGSYSYDSFGRTMSVPAPGAGGSPLTAGYYVDDRAQSMTQNGITRSFAYDPTGRIRSTTTTNQPIQIDHFSGEADSPSWTAIGAADWRRYIPDIVGDMAAVQQGSGSTVGQLTYELTDLQGNVAGETNSSGQLQQGFRANEFGVPQGAQPSSGYGWLGGKERRTQFASGIITMGQRIYVPELGRFLQTDPVPGGSANDYDYVNQDPLDNLDLSGTRCKKKRAQHGVHAPGTRLNKAAGQRPSRHSVIKDIRQRIKQIIRRADDNARGLYKCLTSCIIQYCDLRAAEGCLHGTPGWQMTLCLASKCNPIKAFQCFVVCNNNFPPPDEGGGGEQEAPQLAPTL